MSAFFAAIDALPDTVVLFVAVFVFAALLVAPQMYRSATRRS